MRKEYDFSRAKRAKDIPHLKRLQDVSKGKTRITIMLDKNVADAPGCDHGIASQTIMLGAVEKGLGGCIIATVNRKKLARVLDLPDNLEVLLVLALGVPAQKVVVESLPPDGDIKYWTGDDGNHHVPKRSLDELLVGCFPKK